MHSQITCPENLELQWKEGHQDRDEITPASEIVAIAVDAREIKAAIRIYEKKSGDYVDGVGTEEQGKVVIVPWNSSWVYLCTGTPRVGHILQR